MFCVLALNMRTFTSKTQFAIVLVPLFLFTLNVTFDKKNSVKWEKIILRASYPFFKLSTVSPSCLFPLSAETLPFLSLSPPRLHSSVPCRTTPLDDGFKALTLGSAAVKGVLQCAQGFAFQHNLF